MIECSELLEATGGKLLQGKATAFSHVSIDTRTLAPGDLFVAVKGKNLDGHDYLEQAFAAGAAGALVSRKCEAPENAALVLVDDTTKALADLAASVRLRRSPKVVSVTGSAGKTTTKEIIAHLLSQEFSTLKSAASFNNQFGVPLTLLSLEEEHTHAVVEVGTNHPGEIAPLAKVIAPDVAVITNIGYAHIANFGSQEAIAREKCELFNSLREGGTAVINGDDPHLLPQKALMNKRGVHVITTGFSSSHDLYAAEVKSTQEGSSGFIRSAEWSLPFALHIPGEHFVRGALLAVAAAIACGLSPEKAVCALASFSLPSGRLNTFQLNESAVLIDDTYNASPDAMLSALNTLKLFETKQKIAVLGEMKELGEFSEECHREAGKRAATAVSALIAVGPDAAFLIEGAVEAGLDRAATWHARDALEALQKAGDLLKQEKSAAVLVKGSRFSHMERVSAGLKEMTVKCGKVSCSLYISCEKCELLTTG